MSSKMLPIRRKQFWVGEFATWLTANGGELAKPTNPYEVIRYRAYNASRKPVTHIVYAKDNGLLNWQGSSREHYLAFLAGEWLPSLGAPKVRKPKVPKTDEGGQLIPVGQSARRRRKLVERDGTGCWFCGLEMGDDCTLEHLVPQSRGGGNDEANLVLAHARCNHNAANLSLAEKIEMRASRRPVAAGLPVSGTMDMRGEGL